MKYIGIYLQYFLIISITIMSRHAPILFLQSDTRPLDCNISSADYNSMTAVLNHHFARLHGGQYMYLLQNSENLLDKVQQNYGLNMSGIYVDMAGATVEKNKPACFNTNLKQLRASPWCKLLSIWNITTSIANDGYGHIVFMDSDAAFSAKKMARSIHHAMTSWIGKELWGTQVMNACLILMTTAPFPGLECDGFMIFNSSNLDRLANMIKEWWNFDRKENNFRHAYEQQALDILLTSGHFSLSQNTVSVVNETQFPPFDSSLWVTHAGHPWASERKKIFLQMLYYLGYTDDLFCGAISEISVKEINMYDVSISINN